MIFLATWGCASDFYIIGTHYNNVLIWFTKRILATVFLAHAVAVGETEGAMDSASVFFFCL